MPSDPPELAGLLPRSCEARCGWSGVGRSAEPETIMRCWALALLVALPSALATSYSYDGYSYTYSYDKEPRPPPAPPLSPAPPGPPRRILFLAASRGVRGRIEQN